MKVFLLRVLFASIAQFFVLSLLKAAVVEEPHFTIAHTPLGDLRGAKEKGVYSWKGIRYAQPPVGELRFKAPAPVQPWKGVIDALKYGSSAPQTPTRFLSTNNMNEDCLFLNIWSPAADTQKRPVMIWIHGGGFTVGSGSSEMYNGAALSKKGDVVVVSIHYRLGVLGFLYFDDSIPGFNNNLGIQDQITAIRWVKDNIAAFGGDPDRITIFGESAGGTSVQTLVATPAARGLFTAAIAESGPAAILWPADVACHITSRFLEIVGVKRSDISALKKMPLDSLMKAQEALLQYMVSRTPHKVFSPTIDGQLIVSDIASCLSPGQSGNIALMIGTNKDEATMFARKSLSMMPTTQTKLEKEWMHQMKPELKKQITSAYPAYPKKRAILDLLTDAVFRIPAVRVAECQSKHSPVYMYRFEWTSFLLNVSGLRSCHGLEIPFVFGNHNGRLGKVLRAVSGPRLRKKLTNEMQTAWLNFARYRNPNGEGEQRWKPYNTEERATMIFDKESRPVNDPDKHQREVWEGVSYYY